MRWIYILKCKTGVVYIGETKTLYKRLFQHKRGTGSKTTKKYKPWGLIGLYKLKKDCLLDTTDYDIESKTWALYLENQITLMYMKAMNHKWYDVYGGKYHEGYRPSENPSNGWKLWRPYCRCGIPADINEYKGKRYWRCCKKNGWDGLNKFLMELTYPELVPCEYYREYKVGDKYECDILS